jgi:carbonic anhydrase
VLKEPVFVSQEAIDHLHEVISEFAHYDGFADNNRPVRPLNGRVILNRKRR